MLWIDLPGTLDLAEGNRWWIMVVPTATGVAVGLAGGVGLGPESPIIAIDVALGVWIIGRLSRSSEPATGVVLATAGTIGALFGTPVSAALLLTEMKQLHDTGRLWDRLFAHLVSAGAGALAMHRLFHSLPNPLVAISLGGVVLGVLGSIGGRSPCSRASTRRRN